MLLEPKEWIGRRFPLLRYAEIPIDLGHGEWAVVLINQHCSQCQRLLELYNQRSGLLPPPSFPVRVAVVDLSADDPFDSRRIHQAAELSCPRGRLMSVKKWLAKVPVIIRINDGLVMEVTEPRIQDSTGRVFFSSNATALYHAPERHVQ